VGIGVGSAVIAGIIGTLVGLLAAYAGGKLDTLLMRLADLLLSFLDPGGAADPGLRRQGHRQRDATLVVLEWAYYAPPGPGAGGTAQGIRRGRTRPGLVLAHHARHILPNCLPPLLVIGTLQVARAITLEATLSFLGLGVPITEPSLGLLIANGYQCSRANTGSASSRHRAGDRDRRHQPGGRPPARHAQSKVAEMNALAGSAPSAHPFLHARRRAAGGR
jgi:peptide/nickel transport system permease protein